MTTNQATETVQSSENQPAKADEAEIKKPDTQNRTRLIPVTKWPEYHEYPSIAGLRHLIFYAERNGFRICVKRIGRRVLIDEKKYFEWVERQNPTIDN